MTETETRRLAVLDEVFAAFNRHDADGVMRHFHPDIVFYGAAGSEPGGARFVGADAVRQAFVAVWTAMPDVSWTVRRHAVFGDRAVTEWLFSGTRADGGRIEVEGLDLFEFADDRIVGKSAFRKDRPVQPAA